MANIDKQIFFRNNSGEIEYNEVCNSCPYNCKQSFKCTIVSCKFLKDKKKKRK